ncbi:hypothetical protein CK936_16715 [Streptomyces albireticuli]|uniref:Uncharacterized protein n=1 Tax=Streptomyces albireticuli TaxID=1940 RepID=A0A2A2D918_9ACTN|nr:hypothetical protein CK936_16715 [Streptomyces albireticuli]
MHALTTHCGPTRTRPCEAAAGLVPDLGVDQLAFAARLTTAVPEAAADLTAFLTSATCTAGSRHE